MYVGDKETSKMTQEDADKLQGASAEFAKGKGINAGTMADFVGGMLAQEKSQVTADEMLAKFGEVYVTLEASSTDPEKLMQGMIELMAAGFSTEKAAPMIAVMSEIAPVRKLPTSNERRRSSASSSERIRLARSSSFTREWSRASNLKP